MRLAVRFALAVPLLATLSGAARADGLVITVDFAEDLPDEILNDSLADAQSAEPGSQTSLRAAVMLANHVAGPDTIIVPPGVWKLTNKGQDEEACVTGDLDVTDDLLILGTAPEPGGKQDGSIIDGKKLKDHMFDVKEGVTLTLEGLTLRNGRAAPEQAGGLASVLGSLVLQQVEVRTCKAPAGGGAIHVPAGPGTVTADEVLFYKNKTDGSGGALAVEAGGQAQISSATFQKNHADGEGGSVDINGGIGTFTNVTFSANSAGQDGGAMRLHGSGVLTLVNVTSFANSCKETSGLSALEIGVVNTALLRNTLFDDKGDRNSSGNIISLGGNLDSGTSCDLPAEDNLSGVQPKLLKLKNYGGFTPTHALDPESPAIDSGTDPGCPAFDQRGMPRVDIEDVGPDAVSCDVGAFEYSDP